MSFSLEFFCDLVSHTTLKSVPTHMTTVTGSSLHRLMIGSCKCKFCIWGMESPETVYKRIACGRHAMNDSESVSRKVWAAMTVYIISFFYGCTTHPGSRICLFHHPRHHLVILRGFQHMQSCCALPRLCTGQKLWSSVLREICVTFQKTMRPLYTRKILLSPA